MVKDYSVKPQMGEDKSGPSKETLEFILNYSKSIEMKKIAQEPILIHLN